ncbi:MAG: PKD domain-containing protein [Thermoleophilaceae bacterium]
MTPEANLTALAGSTPTPQLAANARGDTAIAWLDPGTSHVFESDRPAGGAFSQATEISSANAQGLGSVAIDGSGLVYVFFGTDTGTAAAMVPRVATRQVGGSAWTVTPLAVASATDPPQTPIGAVTPSGRAIAVWDQGHTAGNELSKFEFATKPAGSTTWSAKADVTGACGCGSPSAIPSSPSLAIDPAGDAAFLFVRFNAGFVNRILWGETLTAGSSTWTTPNAISTDSASDTLQSQAVVAMDSNGTATATWTRNNNAPNNIVQFATKTLAASSWPAAPNGTSVTPGANDLSPLGSDAGQPTIAVGPDGTTTIAWARGGVIEDRTRAAGGSSFASAATLPTTLTSLSAPFLATAPGGGVVALFAGTSAGQPVVGAASRAAGAAAFTALPAVPGTGNGQPVAAVDDQGNVPAAWIHSSSGQSMIQASGLDVGPPVLSSTSFPGSAVAGKPFAYSAAATDRWSPVTTSWAFGDGATGPLAGTHTYAAAGSFLATLTATDAFGNSASASQAVQVAAAGPSSAPSIAGLSMSPATFKAATKGGSIAGATGTTIRYRVSQQSTTKFTVQRPARGVRKGRRCVAPPKHGSKKKSKPCQRFVDVASFTHVDAAAGSVSFRFTGRLSRRKLAPGHYRLQAVGSNSMGKGKAAAKSFRIVKR